MGIIDNLNDKTLSGETLVVQKPVNPDDEDEEHDRMMLDYDGLGLMDKPKYIVKAAAKYADCARSCQAVIHADYLAEDAKKAEKDDLTDHKREVLGPLPQSCQDGSWANAPETCRWKKPSLEEVETQCKAKADAEMQARAKSVTLARVEKELEAKQDEKEEKQKEKEEKA